MLHKIKRRRLIKNTQRNCVYEDIYHIVYYIIVSQVFNIFTDAGRINYRRAGM